jgi:hypothetical protein
VLLISEYIPQHNLHDFLVNSFIHKKYILFYSAADSLIPIKRFRVRLGSYDLTLRQTPFNTERLRIVRKLLRIYVHPEYEGNNFDIAVLKLNETVIYNAAIRPVCFPEDPGEN